MSVISCHGIGRNEGLACGENMRSRRSRSSFAAKRDYAPTPRKPRGTLNCSVEGDFVYMSLNYDPRITDSQYEERLETLKACPGWRLYRPKWDSQYKCWVAHRGLLRWLRRATECLSVLDVRIESHVARKKNG